MYEAIGLQVAEYEVAVAEVFPRLSALDLFALFTMQQYKISTDIERPTALGVVIIFLNLNRTSLLRKALFKFGSVLPFSFVTSAVYVK